MRRMVSCGLSGLAYLVPPPRLVGRSRQWAGIPRSRWLSDTWADQPLTAGPCRFAARRLTVGHLGSKATSAGLNIPASSRR